MDYKKFVEQLPDSERSELSELWNKINLGWKLSSGLTVKVKSHAEWKAYNDIFVDREYDLPIQQALESRRDHRPFTFLDLGANVGFFTTKVADIILDRETANIDFQGILVEGSPSVYSELKQRISEEAYLRNNLKIINGLIGNRDGVGKLFESDFHITNSLFSQNSLGRSSEVQYTDLDTFYEKDDEIDLLKSDIQGAELSFLENYQQDLLKRVRFAIFELHHDVCDTERCLSILHEEFANHKPLKEKTSHLSNLSVHFFWR